MASRTFLLALLAALVLAGCAATPTTPTGNSMTPTTNVQPPSSMSTAAAGDLLKSAVKDLPDPFGLEMSVKNGSVEMLSMKGFFDNRSKVSYLEMKIAQELLAKNGGEAAMMGGVFANGFAMYTANDASLMILNGTAFAFPPDTKSMGGQTGGQNPMSAFKDIGDPSKLFANISGGGNDATAIKSVTPTVYRNHPALEILASTTKAGKTFDAKAIVFTDPTLLAHIDGNFPPEGNATDDPFSAGTAVMDFYYGNEVKTKVPETATRALGLAYTSGGGGDPFASSRSGSETNATWTFLHSGGVKLSDAVIEIKQDPHNGSMGGMPSPDVGSLPTLWSMKLSDGTKEKDGVTLAFTDHDHDGVVSMGDTLAIAWPQDSAKPNAVLKDAVTGIYVVPGAPIVAFLGLVAIAALARRR